MRQAAENSRTAQSLSWETKAIILTTGPLVSLAFGAVLPIFPQIVMCLNWHALRHFGISMWIAAKLAPKTVQTFAGHSSLQVTMDRYGHLFADAEHKEAMDRIAREMAS